MRRHFQKVEWSDAVLILNYDLNDIPEISYKEEILRMKPTVINNDFKKIK